MRYHHATTQSLEQSEVVLNLWAYVTEDRQIMRISGRAYVLQGNDQEKLGLLRTLSGSDFISAAWTKVPPSLKVLGPEGIEITGVAPASLLSDPVSHSHIFGPLLEELASSLPEQLYCIEGEYKKFRMALPDAPLAVTTIVVECKDGQLVPMVSTETIESNCNTLQSGYEQALFQDSNFKSIFRKILEKWEKEKLVDPSLPAAEDLAKRLWGNSDGWTPYMDLSMVRKVTPDKIIEAIDMFIAEYHDSSAWNVMDAWIRNWAVKSDLAHSDLWEIVEVFEDVIYNGARPDFDY